MKYLFSSNGLAFFDCAGLRLMMSKPERSSAEHLGSIIYFKVQDIEDAHKIMKARGLKFDDNPHFIVDMGSYELWMAFFRDTEDNVLAITADCKKG